MFVLSKNKAYSVINATSDELIVYGTYIKKKKEKLKLMTYKYIQYVDKWRNRQTKSDRRKNKFS